MSAISLVEFNSLNLHEKHEALTEHGTHVAERISPEFIILLYQLDHFYAELYYNNFSNAIEKISGFDGDRKLLPYLKLIDISELR